MLNAILTAKNYSTKFSKVHHLIKFSKKKQPIL